MDKKNVCCLCGKKFEGYGNDPWPLMQCGRCCDDCNQTKVIPERIKRLH